MLLHSRLLEIQNFITLDFVKTTPVLINSAEYEFLKALERLLDYLKVKLYLGLC